MTPIRHNPDVGIMTTFMPEGRVIGFTVAEGLEFRHLHDVAVDAVKGVIAAVPNDDLGVGEKLLCEIEPLDRVVERRHGCVKMAGQSVDLLGVKDRVAFHKRNFDFDVGTAVVGVRPDDLVGVDDQRAFLALAHLSAEPGVVPVFVEICSAGIAG